MSGKLTEVADKGWTRSEANEVGTSGLLSYIGSF